MTSRDPTASRAAVGESVGLAVAVVVHDDEALLDAADDEGCADVEDGRAEVGEAVRRRGRGLGTADFDGLCVGWLPSGGPGSTGGTAW